MKAKSLANKVLFVLQAKVWLKRKQSKVGPQFKSSCANEEEEGRLQARKLQCCECAEEGVAKNVK